MEIKELTKGQMIRPRLFQEFIIYSQQCGLNTYYMFNLFLDI